MSVFQINQSLETKVTEIQQGLFLLRYAYARSRDSRSNNENGQDYITWRVGHDKLVFALCDGVSKSFFGDIGSRILGNMLVDWLWEFQFDQYQTGYDKTRQLENYLNSIVESSGKIIDQVDLKKIDNQYVRDALSYRRSLSGTQSNFVCGILEKAGEKLDFGNIELFWLGDAKLKIFNKLVDLSNQLNATWNSKAGWSSKSGVTGQLQHYQATLNELDTIIAFSDGLDEIDDLISPKLHSSELSIRMTELNDIPGSDDISYLEISTAPFVPPIPPASPQWRKKLAIAAIVSLLLVIVILPFGFLNRDKVRPTAPPPEIVDTDHTIPDELIKPIADEVISPIIDPSPTIEQPIIPIQPTPLSITQISEVVEKQDVRVVSENFIVLLVTGCNDLSLIQGIDITEGQIAIQGPFLVKAYLNNDCFGDPVLVVYEWYTDVRLIDALQSLFVEEILFR